MKTINLKILSYGLIICMTILSCAVIAQNPKNNNDISRKEEKLQQRLDDKMKKYQTRLQSMNNRELEHLREQQALYLKNELEESVNRSNDYIKNRLDPYEKKPEKLNNSAVAPFPKQGYAKPTDYTLNAPTPIADSLALVALYEATDGDNWVDNTNWLIESVSSWYGVETDPNTGEVVYIDLSDNNLVGIIPSEIGNLSSLQYLNLSWNELEGDIPDEIGNLTNLEELYLNENQLTGEIPSQIESLTSLLQLHLGSNELNGYIPDEIGYLTSLDFLELSWNKLGGKIPDSLFNLKNLTILNLSGNALTDTISPNIGNLTLLKTLYLSQNELEGGIPDEIGNLTNLLLIDFSDNHLTGTIPSAIGNLSLLQHLNLDNNSLEGDIPEQFWDLTNLNLISIYGNSFTGTIPPTIGNLNSLKHFEIGNNNFEGTLPYELSYLTNLYQLGIEWNDFEGEIPYDLCEAISGEFRFHNNNFGLENCNVINCLLDKGVNIPDGWQKNGYNLLEDCSDLYVDGATISFGDTCYAANKTIYVGGNWFVVEENAIVKFEAGENIIILPGTHFKEGSMVHARIVTDGIYCALPMMAAVNTQPVEPSPKSMIDFPENKDVSSDTFNVLVYPNPTNALITLVFSEPAVNTLVEVYGLLGERVLTKEISGNSLYELDLSSQPQGIYLIKVSNGNTVVLKKIIKN